MAVVPIPEERLGFLGSCLVEGDSAQETRVRRNKRRALLVSIFFQILIVAALVVFPLFSKGENIANRVVAFPTVPYVGGSNHPHQVDTQHTPRPHHPVCAFCQQPNQIPTGIVMHDSHPVPDPSDPDTSGIPGVPQGTSDGIPISILGVGHTPSGDNNAVPPAQPRRIHVGTIEPAMLIHRIEPVYPPLGRQLHREGRVELRAVISTDGSIQSLEVLSGDPLFIQSATTAVREWRYRATILNGQPVEVETHISVVYTLAH
jgi:periplasmic protein TonB